jgi:hypothetical protein
LNNKKFAVVLLVAVLMFSLQHTCGATSGDLPNQGQALSFLKNVVQLDTSLYAVTPVGQLLDYPAMYGGLPVGTNDLTLLLLIANCLFLIEL